ncbi:uncharacterized protein LOC135169164 [Diachasmimorpha longicaudata]|uniref:uncharacterized protein LOC135169164 n=1 Tax=Diachasmimorpha longicaudata TaxID=58733 RepID=UPI0030B87135
MRPQGSRCVCQRYENGELVVATMNNRNPEPDNNYQNPRSHQRIYQNRPPNLNPHYQNPVDLVHNHNQLRRQNEPEENIYERLDNDDEVNEILEVRRNDQNDHMYERIDNRSWSRGNQVSRNINPILAFERNSRDIYFQNPSCLSRLGNLSRNCFSTDNVAMATNGRLVYQFGQCMCQFCMRLPFIRYHICQQCNTFNSGNYGANSRHYIYQVSRNCRCAFCRGEYSYRFPINARGLVESLRCQCRNPSNCSCRGRLLSSSNSAIYIGRIDRIGSVNNPLYANPSVYVGRIERNAGAGGEGVAEGGVEVAAGEPGPSGEARAQPASSVCNVSNAADRQHTCDDSCIRGQGGICQFARTERPECHGRFSYNWWFGNRWLAGWGSADRGTEGARGEDSREPTASDSDD